MNEGVSDSLMDALSFIESSDNPDAVSSKGAIGQYQIMSETAKNAGFGMRKIDLKNSSPEEQREWSREYLGKLKDKYNGNMEHTLMAYNWGTGNVDKWIKEGGPVPKETKDYVKKFKDRGVV